MYHRTDSSEYAPGWGYCYPHSIGKGMRPGSGRALGCVAVAESNAVSDVCFSLNEQVSAGGSLAPRGRLAMSRDISDCHDLLCYLASSEWRPEMLFNTLECTGQPPNQKNYSICSVSSAVIEKPCSK